MTEVIVSTIDTRCQTFHEMYKTVISLSFFSCICRNFVINFYLCKTLYVLCGWYRRSCF